ncbi:MAG TPA: hypothetical protein V6C65_39525, partial [Allocoleopsis sp.]
TQGSWALPLLHERITSAETPIEKAAAQLAQVCQKLTTRPLSLWDAEYGCAPFLLKTADLNCDKLIRLRSNRVLYGAPPPCEFRKLWQADRTKNPEIMTAHFIDGVGRGKLSIPWCIFLLDGC